MPKKKTASRNKSNKLLPVFLIVAIVTVLYLASQLQEKDRQLKQLRNNSVSENTEDKKRGDLLPVVKKHVLNKEQETAARNQIKDNLEVLVGRKPKMADKWFLSDIKFKDNGTVTLFYEDGHEAGEITFKIIEPANSGSWQKTGNR